MRYCIDIDGTICTPTVGRGYEKATPYTNRIQQINELYDEDTTSSSLLPVLWVGSVVIQMIEERQKRS